jgi:hypothetical protein
MKTYLAVPFAEKDQAKALGARWDAAERAWYVPATRDLAPFAKWNVAPLTELPGEDRAFGGSHLFVDLVPRSCWFTNVRSGVVPQDWERLRRLVTGRVLNRCEVCRADGRRGPSLEAHERWDYVQGDAGPVQVLRRLVGLCQACHEVTHYGLAGVRGRAPQALLHLQRVNGWDAGSCELHVEAAFEEWHARNRVAWRLDLGLIERAGIRVQPVEAAQRAEVAEAQLAVVGAPSRRR